MSLHVKVTRHIRITKYKRSTSKMFKEIKEGIENMGKEQEIIKKQTGRFVKEQNRTSRS